MGALTIRAPASAGALLGALLAAGLADAAELSLRRDEPREATAYQRLLASLPEMTVRQRDAFALIALDEMLLEHAEALDRVAESAPRTARERGKQLRWASNTRQYAGWLEAVAARANASGAYIEVTRAPEGSVHLQVDGELVVVSTMDMRRPRLMGERIVVSWCGWFDCAFLEPEELEPPPGAAPTATWSFGDRSRPALRTSDGLVFEFTRADQRERKEQLCLAVAAELRAVVTLLGEVERAGHRIDWSALDVTHGADGTRLVVNREGDFVRARLPILAAAPALLTRGRPWVSARAAGRIHVQHLRGARLLLAPLLSD